MFRAPGNGTRSDRRVPLAPLSFSGVLLATICAAVSGANGQTCSIYLYEVDKNVSYTQVSNAAPTVPDAWYFHAGLFYETFDVVTAASLTFNRPPNVTLDLIEAGPTTHQFYSAFYADRPSMDADFPAGTYTMSATCDAEHSATVDLPVNLFCTAIPHFTGTTHDRLQGLDTTAAFVGTINGFARHPAANIGITSIAISQDMVGGVFTTTLLPGETQFVVPAGTLQPNADHLISVSYTCILATPGAGFDGASGDAAFSRGTSISFRTGPIITCDADFNHDGFVNSQDFFDDPPTPLFGVPRVVSTEEDLIRFCAAPLSM